MSDLEGGVRLPHFNEQDPFRALQFLIPSRLEGMWGVVDGKAGSLADARHISPQDSPIHIQLPQLVTDTYKLVYISHQARGDSDSGECSPADSQGVDTHQGPALREARSLEHLDIEAA